jgi:hypothetical protein
MTASEETAALETDTTTKRLEAETDTTTKRLEAETDTTTKRLEGVEQTSPTLPVTELLDSQAAEGSSMTGEEEQNTVSDDDPVDEDISANVEDDNGADVPSLEGDMAAVVSEIMDKLESPEPQATMIKDGLLTPPVQILEISLPDSTAILSNNHEENIVPETSTQQTSLTTDTGISEEPVMEMKISGDSNLAEGSEMPANPAGEPALNSNSLTSSSIGIPASESSVAPEQPIENPVQEQPGEISKMPLNTDMATGLSAVSANTPTIDQAGEPLTPSSLELVSNQIIIDEAVAAVDAGSVVPSEPVSTASSDLAGSVAGKPLGNDVTDTASVASVDTGSTASTEPLGISTNSPSESSVTESALPNAEESVNSSLQNTPTLEVSSPIVTETVPLEASGSPPLITPDVGATNALAEGAPTAAETTASSAPETLISSSSEAALPTVLEAEVPTAPVPDVPIALETGVSIPPEAELPTVSESVLPASPETVVTTAPEPSVSNPPDAAISEAPVSNAPEASVSVASETSVSSVSDTPDATEPNASEGSVPSAPEVAGPNAFEAAVPSATESLGVVVSPASGEDSQKENTTTGATLSSEAPLEDNSPIEDSQPGSINSGRNNQLYFLINL